MKMELQSQTKHFDISPFIRLSMWLTTALAFVPVSLAIEIALRSVTSQTFNSLSDITHALSTFKSVAHKLGKLLRFT